jgi:hypothetical protein
MRGYFAHPTPPWIVALFVAAAALFVVSAWMANAEDPETSVYAFLPILVGMTILFIGLAQLVLWALNRAQKTPRA